MKIRLFIAAMMVMVLNTTVYAQEEEEQIKTPFKYETGLKYCEGTTVYRNHILVSNFGEIGELDPLNNQGKGYIMSLGVNGDSKVLIPCDGTLSAPKGMEVVGGNLYIADVGKVVVYNLNKPNSKPQIVKLPDEDLFANDMVSIGNIVLVSVTNTGNIYGIDISNPKELEGQTPKLMGNVSGANGMVVNDHMIYIASYNPSGVPTEENVIYAIDILAENGGLTKLIPNLPAGMYDGIALSDDKSTLFFTTWANPNSEAALYFYKLDGSNAYRKVDMGDIKPHGPADISIKNGYIYIPDLPQSVVYRLPL